MLGAGRGLCVLLSSSFRANLRTLDDRMKRAGVYVCLSRGEGVHACRRLRGARPCAAPRGRGVSRGDFILPTPREAASEVTVWNVS